MLPSKSVGRQQVIYCLAHTEAGNLLSALNHLKMEMLYPCRFVALQQFVRYCSGTEGGGDDLM